MVVDSRVKRIGLLMTLAGIGGAIVVGARSAGQIYGWVALWLVLLAAGMVGAASCRLFSPGPRGD